MEEPTRILFLAAEADPFVKVGGLGDVAGSLPCALASLPSAQDGTDRGIEIRLVLPYHHSVCRDIHPIIRQGEFVIPTRQGDTPVEVHASRMDGVAVYFLRGPWLPPNGPVYSLNASLDMEKFGVFSIASLFLTREWGWAPDILHVNDWHTALAAYALPALRRSLPTLRRTRSVLTLHNLPFMGADCGKLLARFGMSPSRTPALPKWGRRFPLPLGLLKSDRIVAVSPSYAHEILTPEFGCSLENFLQTRQESIQGILNGLDSQRWNPSSDPHLSANFDLDHLQVRRENTCALRRETGLDDDPRIPLLAIISRMDHQKGIDLALNGIRRLKNTPFQLVILGTGNPDLEDDCQRLADEFPAAVRYLRRFDMPLSHRIYAGADMLLMPSRYEPCGLAQMIAMRYGCVPVAREIGGLKDTIVSSGASQTGILFSAGTPEGAAQAIKDAIRIFHRPDAWKRIQRAGMQRDFSWGISARQYAQLYRCLKEGQQ